MSEVSLQCENRKELEERHYTRVGETIPGSNKLQLYIESMGSGAFGGWGAPLSGTDIVNNISEIS